MCGLVMLGLGDRGGVIKLERPDKHTTATMQTGVIDLNGTTVIWVSDDEAAIRQQQQIAEAVAAVGGARKVAVVVTECGKPHDRPSYMPSGVPVYYPCKDKLKFR